MKEEWKTIKNTNGLYSVSNLGRVKANNRIVQTKTGNRNYKEKILLQETTNCGYLRVVLSVGGKYLKKSVHRLVAEEFIPNPNKLPQVNHIDGNKQNNNVNNLEWISISDNIKHAYNNGLAKIDNLKEANSKPIIMYSKETDKPIKEFSSMTECSQETGYNVTIISYHCNSEKIIKPRKLNVYFRFK